MAVLVGDDVYFDYYTYLDSKLNGGCIDENTLARALSYQTLGDERDDVYWKLCNMAGVLSSHYHAAISLTTDGLFMGFVFEQHGFPLSVVQAKRRDGRVDVKLPETLRGIQDRTVLLLEDVVETGTTLAVVAQELQSFSPRRIDALIALPLNSLTTARYQELAAQHSLPQPYPHPSSKDSVVLDARDYRIPGISLIMTL